jgi:hypothetical protein
MNIVNFLVLLVLTTASVHALKITTIAAPNPLDTLAAKELSRYTYLLDVDRRLVRVADSLSMAVLDDGSVSVLVSTNDKRCPITSSGSDAFAICEPQQGIHVIAGVTPTATLYGVYHYLELLGMGFSTSGAMMPPPSSTTAAVLPPGGVQSSAIFTTRGLQPFHDFSEGPDWWSEDEYKRVIECIAQMKGNMIAFHTYPIGGPTEPAVWVGLKENVDASGNVTVAYSSTWSNTQRTAWGYTPMNTSLYPWGAGMMYEHECFGHPIQSGKANLCPAPVTPQDEVLLFNEVGVFYQSVFAFAHILGVKTVIGTETPISTPPGSSGTSQDFYEGMLTRLQLLYGSNLDYYWIWTPEVWEWNQVNITDPTVQNVVADTKAIVAAHASVNASFGLATCGWVVGPLGARWYFDSVLPSDWLMSSIDMNVGNTEVDPAYANLTHRTTKNKMFIAWSEDDPGLTAPELWLNRTLLHEATAVSYGVGGMMNIHWRTRADSATHAGSHAYAWDQTISHVSFYASWCTSQFGTTIGPRAADVFSSIDSYNLPRPVNWGGGPGQVAPGASNCNWATAYAWVDTFIALRPDLVKAISLRVATEANLESFDYWANQFDYMRGIAKFECDWANYNTIISAIQQITNVQQQQQAARTQGFNARISLVYNLTMMMGSQIRSTTGIEGAGTIHNLITHSLQDAIGAGPTSLLQKLANQSLPADGFPPAGWDKEEAPSLRVPTVRSILDTNEPLRIRAWILTTLVPSNVTLYYRALGGQEAYSQVPLTRVTQSRSVYTTSLAPQAIPEGGCEYYIEAVFPTNGRATFHKGLGIPAGTVLGENSVSCFFPPTAPFTPATIVVA